MTQITLNSITGLTYPYTVYVCNVYGLNCVLLAVVNTNVPAPVSILLPSPQFDMAPAVGIKIVTSDGCVRFEIVNCTSQDEGQKQFQDLELFDFMDGTPYYFQN